MPTNDITIAASYIAFALSLLPTNSLVINKNHPLRLHLNSSFYSGPFLVRKIELVSSPILTEPPVLSVYLADDEDEPIAICNNHHYYAFTLPPYHPLLQLLPFTPFSSPLHLPLTLCLQETHALLSNSLHALQIPPETLHEWPHPLTLTFKPQWPRQLATIDPNTHPHILEIYYDYTPSWPLDKDTPADFRPSCTSQAHCTLNDPSFHTPSDPTKPPLLIYIARHFLYDNLLPLLPPEWKLVYWDDLEPTDEHPSHVLITPLQLPPLSVTKHPALLHCYSFSFFALLLTTTAINTPLNIPLSNSAINPLHYLHGHDLFRTPAPPLQSLASYTATALNILRTNSDIAHLHALSC